MIDETLSLIDAIANALRYKFPNDPSAPGLIISKLYNGDNYVSLVRYMEKYGQGKEVLYFQQSPSLIIALKTVATTFLFRYEEDKSPIQQLKDLIAPPLSPLNKEKMRGMMDLVLQNNEDYALLRSKEIINKP